MHIPSFASSLHFELYKSTERFYLQVSYRTDRNERLIKFPVCGVKCTIEDIRRIYHNILPLDEMKFDEECRLPFYIRQNHCKNNLFLRLSIISGL